LIRKQEEGGVMKRLMLLVASLLTFGAAERPASATALRTIDPGITVDVDGSLGPGAVSLDDGVSFSLGAVQSSPTVLGMGLLGRQTNLQA
jgi:hypothetical protein